MQYSTTWSNFRKKRQHTKLSLLLEKVIDLPATPCILYTRPHYSSIYTIWDSLLYMFRIRNSLFGFLSESLNFCEWKSHLLFSKSNCEWIAPFTLQKRITDQRVTGGIHSLAQKGEKQWKNVKNIVKTTIFFEWSALFLRAKEHPCALIS